jgi:hypothetical protein
MKLRAMAASPEKEGDIDCGGEDVRFGSGRGLSAIVWAEGTGMGSGTGIGTGGGSNLVWAGERVGLSWVTGSDWAGDCLGGTGGCGSDCSHAVLASCSTLLPSGSNSSRVI